MFFQKYRLVRHLLRSVHKNMSSEDGTYESNLTSQIVYIPNISHLDNMQY